jgi:hypothetical protein
MDEIWFTKLWGDNDNDEYTPPKRRTRNRKQEEERVIKRLRKMLQTLEEDYRTHKISGRVYAKERKALLQQYKIITGKPMEEWNI